MGDAADELYDRALMQEAELESDSIAVEKAIKKMDSDYIYGQLEWNSLNGPILVTKMTTDHIKNTIPFIQRGGTNLVEPICEKWIEIFKIELEKRGV